MGLHVGTMGHDESRTTARHMKENWRKNSGQSFGGGTERYNEGILW